MAISTIRLGVVEDARARQRRHAGIAIAAATVATLTAVLVLVLVTGEWGGEMGRALATKPRAHAAPSHATCAAETLAAETPAAEAAQRLVGQRVTLLPCYTMPSVVGVRRVRPLVTHKWTTPARK
jgi:hypothetical protein